MITRSMILTGVAVAIVSNALAQEPAATKFVPFGEFVQSVKSADANEVLARPAAKVADTPAVEEMRQHLVKLYDGISVSHSYVVEAQTVDCVPAAQQPSVRLSGLNSIATAPPASALDASPASPRNSERQKVAQLPSDKSIDAFGNRLGCETGTIPLRRITLDQLSRFKTLHEFFEKGPDGSGRAPEPGKEVPPSSFAHKYGITYQYVNNHGDNTNIGLWRPYVYTDINEIFTLAQSWTIGVSANPVQTVEVGWQNYPARTGTESSTPFIYYTADGYQHTGCYDLTCGAFVQVNNSITFGLRFLPQYYSVPDGPQYEIQARYYLYNGNWWLNFDGTWVGYYPGWLFGGGQLAHYSNLLEFGGESVGLTVWPGEGSGLWAANWWEYADYQRLLWYQDTANAGFWDSLTAYQPSPACYTVTTPAYASNWGTYFFFGGPGGASCQ